MMIEFKNLKLAGHKLGIGKEILEVSKEGCIHIEENDKPLIEALLASGFEPQKKSKSEQKVKLAVAPKIENVEKIAPKAEKAEQKESEIKNRWTRS